MKKTELHWKDVSILLSCFICALVFELIVAGIKLDRLEKQQPEKVQPPDSTSFHFYISRTDTAKWKRFFYLEDMYADTIRYKRLSDADDSFAKKFFSR